MISCDKIYVCNLYLHLVVGINIEEYPVCIYLLTPLGSLAMGGPSIYSVQAQLGKEDTSLRE